jgi:hypothetical protein
LERSLGAGLGRDRRDPGGLRHGTRADRACIRRTVGGFPFASATIDARTLPSSAGSPTLLPTAPSSLAPTTTLAAATPILPPPAASVPSASSDTRASTASVAARAADARVARPGTPRAKATTVRTASKPARRAAPPTRAPAPVRAEGRPSEQRVAARPARGDVFVN